MKEDKFKIINLIKELIINIDRNLVNFPKKDIPVGKYNARNYRAEGASDDAHNVKSDNPDFSIDSLIVSDIAIIAEFQPLL